MSLTQRFWVAYFRANETERADAVFCDSYSKSLVGERGKRISDSVASLGKYVEWSFVSSTVFKLKQAAERSSGFVIFEKV